ncbi:ComF family protein [Psychrobacter sp. K31L]|nr:ComF family protein [Psychrobacter sp. K31L]
MAAGNTLSIQAATYYDYPIRQAIRAFKHHEDMTKLPLLLHALRQLPRPHGCHHDNSVIVAMPTTNQRLIKRGFDPVSILSAHLSKHWQIPLWHGVQRIDDTISQQGLTRAERLSNLDNAFALIESPPAKRLILFDDVATTGASLQALGRALHSLSGITSLNNAPTSHKYPLIAYALAHGSQS